MTLKYFSKTASAASLQFGGVEQQVGPELASSILAAHVFGFVFFFFFSMELVILGTVETTLEIMRQYKNITLLWGRCSHPMLGVAVQGCGVPLALLLLPFLPPEDVNLCSDLKACVSADIAHTSCLPGFFFFFFFGEVNPRLQPCPLEGNMGNAVECSA